MVKIRGKFIQCLDGSWWNIDHITSFSLENRQILITTIDSSTFVTDAFDDEREAQIELDSLMDDLANVE